MPFNPDPKIKDINEVSEGLRGLYKEVKEGDKVVGYELKPDVSKALSGDDLKDENNKLRNQLKESFAKFDELESKLKEFQTKPKETEQTKPNDKLSDLEKKFNNQLAAMQKEQEALKSENKKLQETADKERRQSQLQRKESLVLDAIREKGGIPTLIKDHIMSQIEVDNEKTGKESLYVRDKDGTPKFQGSQKMGIDLLLEEMKNDKDYSRAFVENKKGMALDSFQGKGVEIKSTTFNSKMTPQQEADYIMKHGKEAYLEQTQKMVDNRTDQIKEANRKASHSSSSLLPEF